MSRKVRVTDRFRQRDGFSALELLMTVGIMGVLMSVAIAQISQTIPGYKGDGAMRIVIAQINTAREMAITQRRIMRLTFTNTNQVSIVREEVTSPASTTTLSAVQLESGAKFNLVAGVPDTPDAFGNSSATYFGTATQIRFSTDGTLIDQSGFTLNGSVFVSIPNMPRSLRAVTVLGSTGRVRGYRWDGTRWKLV
jgi:prepilin-type N-terminal cleavage/methylation domain-containing protein